MPDGSWICRKENISDIVVVLGIYNIEDISFEDGYEFGSENLLCFRINKLRSLILQ